MNKYDVWNESKCIQGSVDDIVGIMIKHIGT